VKNKFCIRKLIEEDIEAVTLLYASVLDPSYISFSEIGEGKAISPNTLSQNADDIFRKQLSSLIHSPDHGFFVIHENDRIIGFALASLNTTDAGYIECCLDDICVAKEQQNKGVAKLLIDYVIQWGTNRGANFFLLESGIKNHSAHHLFESIGFQPLATVFWRKR
jgi:GNAT superfamily N-acetyltransferase